MTVYYITFPGMYFGGNAVVVAATAERARELAHERVTKTWKGRLQGPPSKDKFLVRPIDRSTEAIFECWDGDY